MENILDQSFWDDRWETGRTGWDIGYPSPPIMQFMSQYAEKNHAILIPGCGNAYEAEFLVENGFTDITLLDIAPKAVERLQQKFKKNKQVKVICEDFFQHQGKYDLLIEQTFFCTHPLEKRPAYVNKAASLLKKRGEIIGLLFQVDLGTDHPPFGGSISEYRHLFEPYFEIKIMEESKNSIPSRAGMEAFIHLQKSLEPKA